MSGVLDKSTAQVIQQVLSDLSQAKLPSVGQGATDWPVWTSSLPDDPDNAIMVSDTAGTTEGRFMTDGQQQEHTGITITVRSNRPSIAFTKARAIKIALDEEVDYLGVTVGSNSYTIHSVSTRPGPIYAGFEEGTNRNLYTLNAVVSLEQTA